MDDSTACARNSVQLRALLKGFLDGGSQIATLKIEPRAAVPAGDIFLNGQPSDRLLGALTALTAKDREVKRFCVAHGFLP